MARKFFTEFGLNVSTAYKTIIPIEHLEKVNDGRKYHIYFILSCPKIFIKSDSVTQFKQGISLSLYKIEHGEESVAKDVSFTIAPGIDHSKITISCKYPFTNLEVELETGEKVSIDAQAISTLTCTYDPWIFDVLYIGQSYGKDGGRLAQDRLQSHSTLQKILTDCNSKYPDRRIYIFLWEINPILNTTMDGIHEARSSEEDDEAHFLNVLSNPLETDQMINIAEAALINYFKPYYNVNFVDNFPNKDHKGYKQYFDLDYNSLVIELDLEFDYPYPCIQFQSDANSIKCCWDFIEYDLHNDPDRPNMFDIFGAKTID